MVLGPYPGLSLTEARHLNALTDDGVGSGWPRELVEPPGLPEELRRDFEVGRSGNTLDAAVARVKLVEWLLLMGRTAQGKAFADAALSPATRRLDFGAALRAIKKPLAERPEAFEVLALIHTLDELLTFIAHLGENEARSYFAALALERYEELWVGRVDPVELWRLIVSAPSAEKMEVRVASLLLKHIDRADKYLELMAAAYHRGSYLGPHEMIRDHFVNETHAQYAAKTRDWRAPRGLCGAPESDHRGAPDRADAQVDRHRDQPPRTARACADAPKVQRRTSPYGA